MHTVVLRDPVSALSHLFGCIAGMYLTLLFWRLTHSDRVRRYASLCFGLSIVILYAASTAYHWVVSPESAINFCRRLDHSAIFVLIAGTYTPIFVVLLRDPLRTRLIVTLWVCVVVGIAVKWIFPLGHHNWSVLAFLALGWIGMIPVFHIRRAVGWKPLLIGLSGGVCYTIGGICDAVEWPTFYPPLFRPHEFMHFMDLAGTSIHVYFLICYVLPYQPPVETPPLGGDLS